MQGISYAYVPSAMPSHGTAYFGKSSFIFTPTFRLGVSWGQQPLEDSKYLMVFSNL